jgi:voltage-gated potassium channel
MSRLAYITNPWVIVDLLSFVPTLILFIPTNTVALRILRLLKFIRFAKLGRYSKSVRNIYRAISNKRSELIIAFFVSFIFLLFSATLLHLIEGDVQPEQFGSIPRSLWWSVVTLTTVGYGDVYPITLAGRIVAGCIAYIAIGTIALPAGILASGFTEKNND